jgi:type VI secretion system protein ImpF
MPKAEQEPTAELSLLDRLFDDEPGQAGDRAMTRADSVREFKVALRRDLEWLLNTRRTLEPNPTAYPELTRSVLYYGLPDISSLSQDSGETYTRLSQHVAQALSIFEPRLARVKVSAVPRDDTPYAQVRFVVEAVLRLEPTPERVTFDTALEKGSGGLSVGGVTDA